MSVVFSYRSRAADSFVALPEVVVQPPRYGSEGQVSIRVRSGSTRELDIPFRSRNPIRIRNHRRTIDLSGKYLFDSRFETDGNISHQIRWVAMPVLLARKEISSYLGRDIEISVILRAGASAMSVALYEQLGIPTIQTDSQVVGELVCVKDDFVTTRIMREVLGPGRYSSCLALADEILREIPPPREPLDDVPERIFIARKGSRGILNEKQVSDFLAHRGFVTVYFEDIPVSQQMRLCRHSKVIAGIHGAGMAHMLFNDNGLARPPGDLSGLRIIELFGGYMVDLHRRCAAILNAHWCGVRGQITPGFVRDLDLRGCPRAHESTPFLIDLETLEMALDYSESASRTPQTTDLWSCLSSAD